MGMFLANNQRRREELEKKKAEQPERENAEKATEESEQYVPRRGRPPKNDDM